METITDNYYLRKTNCTYIDLAKLYVLRGQTWVVWWHPVAPLVSL